MKNNSDSPGYLLRLARAKRRSQNYHEYTLWQMLRRYSLGMGFYHQYPLGGFIVDFYCPRVRLAVELDGPWHQTPAGVKHDAREREVLERWDIDLLRFTIASMGPFQMKATIAAYLKDKNVASVLPLGEPGVCPKHPTSSRTDKGSCYACYAALHRRQPQSETSTANPQREEHSA